MPAIDRTKLEKAAPKPSNPSKVATWDNYLRTLCGVGADVHFLRAFRLPLLD